MKRLVVIVAVALMLAACGTSTAEENQPVELLLGFRPDVQFAPFYMGVEEGIFADAGFDITITHASESDIARQVATNPPTDDVFRVGVISGEQHLLAHAQGLPITYVYGWYQDYPIAVVAKEGANITEVSDLAGRSVGVPMMEGASYLGLAAILDAEGLTEDDIDLQVTGFTQVETLVTDQVEAVVVYTANEPTQLRERGEAVTVLSAADYTDLVGNGLIVNNEQVEATPEQVQAFISAFDEALAQTIANPDQAFEHSKAYVEGLDDPDVEPIARQVLANSLPQWQTDSGDRGTTDPASWAAMQAILLDIGLLSDPLVLDEVYTTIFVP